MIPIYKLTRNNFSFFYLVAFLLLGNFNKLHAQTYIKKEWTASSGTTDSIIHRAAKTDSNRNLIVVDNIKNNNEAENICISKFDSNGQLLWQQQINGTANLNDYGTDVLLDSSNFIYACGAKLNLLNGYDIYVAKFDENGTLIWETEIDNNLKNDIPVSLDLNNNKLFICGSSALGLTNSDISVYSINAINGNIHWDYYYDFDGYYDIPAKIIVKNSKLYVTGASGTSLLNWEIATIELDTAGTFLNERRISNT